MLELYKGNKDIEDAEIMSQAKDENKTDEADTKTNKLDKSLEIISSVCLSISISSLLNVLWGKTEGVKTLLAITGATVLLSPTVNFGLKKLKEELENRAKKDIREAYKLADIIQEKTNSPSEITSATSIFLTEIVTKFQEENITLPTEQILTINQFLYLINANYYEKIIEKNKELTRTQLLALMLEKISTYLKETKRETFGATDVSNLLYYCPFIEEKLKMAINNEFEQGPVITHESTMYEIRRDAPIDLAYHGKNSPLKTSEGFDIDNGNDYYELILSLLQDQEYYAEKSYRNPRDIDWDIGYLKKVVKIIVRDHEEELLERDNNYPTFHMVASLADNCLMYALINNKTMVDQDVIIKTFKNWDYLSFDLKLSILDTLFTEENIDYSNHPFGVSKKRVDHPTQKIIRFKPKQTIESE